MSQKSSVPQAAKSVSQALIPDKFASFVEYFANDLPFLSTCLINKDGRCDDDMLHYLFYATRGRPGALSKLIEAATIEAFEDPKAKEFPTSLGIEHFRTAFDYLLKNDSRMLGVNPFRANSSKDLRTIPYDLEAEEFAAREAEIQKRSAKRKGRRLYPK